MEIDITLTVNGKEEKLKVSPTETLTETLRERLHLTSVKKGCESGDCGACSVIMNGKLMRSCIILAPMADGAEITTVEGLSRDGELNELQRKFVELHATQCGFCTPGMILAAKVLLDENPNPSEEDIKRALSGNLCRCTGYQNQIKAIKETAKC